MTITNFQRNLTPGCVVYNNKKQRTCTVLRISKDGDKALVQYDNGTKEWAEYYILDFSNPNE